MNYLQIARETLSVESQALEQLNQRLDDEFLRCGSYPCLRRSFGHRWYW